MTAADNHRRFYPGGYCLVAHQHPAPNRRGHPAPQYVLDWIIEVTPDSIRTAQHGAFSLADLNGADGRYRLARPDHLTDLPKPGWYADNWRRLKALSDDDASTIRPFWNWAGESVKECKAAVRLAMHKRILARGGYCPQWRKWTNDTIWTGWLRDKWRIHDRTTRRVIIRQFESAEARQRFSHLLTTHEDL